jgi:hypothetical protein
VHAGCRARWSEGGWRQANPTMAPSVFAAYALPTMRAGSSPREASDASASGKLAPQRTAAGQDRVQARGRDRAETETRDRSRIDGLIGQYGRDAWQHVRGPGHPRATATPGTRRAPCAGGRGVPRASSRRCCRGQGRREKTAENQRERVEVVAPKAAQRARPQHFCRQRRHPGQGEHQVHDPTIAHWAPLAWGAGAAG